MKNDQIFFVGQKAFIERDGSVLVIKKSKEIFELPGGKIQEGEDDFIESMRREVREETGLEIEVGNVFYAWHFFLPPEHSNAGKIVYLVGYKCRYRGGDVKLSDDHKEYEWVNSENYKELNHSSPHFKALEKYFESR
jgi:8-oxo-dGTP diphosphatase